MDNTPQRAHRHRHRNKIADIFLPKNFGISKISVNFALELIRFQFLNTNFDMINYNGNQFENWSKFADAVSADAFNAISVDNVNTIETPLNEISDTQFADGGRYEMYGIKFDITAPNEYTEINADGTKETPRRGQILRFVGDSALKRYNDISQLRGFVESRAHALNVEIPTEHQTTKTDGGRGRGRGKKVIEIKADNIADVVDSSTARMYIQLQRGCAEKLFVAELIDADTFRAIVKRIADAVRGRLADVAHDKQQEQDARELFAKMSAEQREQFLKMFGAI